MDLEELQAAIDWWDTGGPSRPLPSEVVVAINRFVEAARIWLNPNYEALARLIADHRGVDWADKTYMDACRRMAEQYVAVALTPGDTKAATEPDGCHAQIDGDCEWKHCPQVRDGEPKQSGRHCPLDIAFPMEDY